MVKQPELVWRNPAGANNSMDRYRRHVNERFRLNLQDSHQLHAWSVEKLHDFWIDVHSYLEIIPPLPKGTTKAYDDSKRMSEIPLFFEGYRLNYTENILSNRPQNSTALIGIREGESLDGYERLTWGQLSERVRKTRSALLRHGIKQGDRVAAWMGNHIFTTVLFLAVGAIGAIFTSVSPDMGIEGTLSRFRQIQPSLLFIDSHSIYKGRKTPTESKLKVVVNALGPTPPVVFVNPVIEDVVSSYPLLEDFSAKANPDDALEYSRVPFNHPFVIVYSSGTSGPPKCIIHQQGNIVQFKKIAVLHNSLGPSSVVLQYTTTSWVMFYVMNGHLSAGAAAITYDGSPLHPHTFTILDLLDRHRVTYWGTSPRHLHGLQTAHAHPRTTHALSHLALATTTGAPLHASQHRWFTAAFPAHVQLSSVAGGTDVQTSYLATDPAGDTYAGEMQMVALGMAVDVADTASGQSVREEGREGELVVRAAFPSMPVGFWGDDAGCGAYRAAYFGRFGGECWVQGDWVRMNARTRGWVMSGRSDGVLNPSGVRFGSGEVYAVVEREEQFRERVEDVLCVGRRRAGDLDEMVFLFVKMLPGKVFNEGLRRGLKDAVRNGLSPKHVPRFVVEVPDVPVTVNGKKVEIAVKQIISGKEVKVSSTVANPEALEHYRQFVEMEREPPASKL